MHHDLVIMTPVNFLQLRFGLKTEDLQKMPTLQKMSNASIVQWKTTHTAAVGSERCVTQFCQSCQDKR